MNKSNIYSPFTTLIIKTMRSANTNNSKRLDSPSHSCKGANHSPSISLSPYDNGFTNFIACNTKKINKHVGRATLKSVTMLAFSIGVFANVSVNSPKGVLINVITFPILPINDLKNDTIHMFYLLISLNIVIIKTITSGMLKHKPSVICGNTSILSIDETLSNALPR